MVTAWNKGIEHYIQQDVTVATSLCGVAMRFLNHLPVASQHVYQSKFTDAMAKLQASNVMI